MKLLKPILYSTLTALALTSCSSTSKVKNSVVDKKINFVAKKSKLTDTEINKWQHLDLATDSIPGMSINKAYQFLQGKKGTEIIVGVIDTGVDLKHEDLKDVAWINEDEIKNNGIDDDKNGYVDDINGWNFLGKMEEAHFESERILNNPSQFDPKIIASLKKEQEESLEFAKEQMPILTEDKIRAEQMLRSINNADKAFIKHFGRKNYTKKDILNIKTTNEDLKKQVSFIKQMFEYGGNSVENLKSEIIKSINLLNKQYNKNQQLLAGTYLSNDFRKVLGDNPNDINDKNYGNANVQPLKNSEEHGSHVAGIIAAKRNNGIGIDGITANAKIMVVRTIPAEGDEYDKDVALAIRYAVDNGAKVINGSFGKEFSPHKQWVYDAIKYAAKKDVLIVNAAGNSGTDIDKKIYYPNDTPTKFKEIVNNFIVVGASGSNYNKTLVPNFSNYGKQNVDVFAPGEKIYATIPNNKYERMDGTSMAAPCVAGVAALVRSYYPQLKAEEVKRILVNSGTKINLKVIKPSGLFTIDLGYSDEEGEKLVPFSNLSVSGGIVNAYNAVRMADKIVNNTNKKTLQN